MTVFWIAAVLLALVCALLIVLPLWRDSRKGEELDLLALNRRVFQERLAELEKDCAEGRIDAGTLAELRTELERNLLALQDDQGALMQPPKPAGRRVALAALLLLPVLALGFYYAVLEPRSLGQWLTLQREMGPAVDKLLAGQSLTESDTGKHTLGDFVRLLQDRLQKDPGNAEGWFMLGMSYVQLGLGEPAATAFEHAWRLKPDEPRNALALAQTRIFSNDGQLDPFSQQLLEGVLAREPQHEGALVLLGFGAYRSGDYATAVAALEKLQQLRAARHASSGPAMLQQLASTLADARAKLQAEKSGHPVVAAGGAPLRVKVEVDRSLAGQYSPDDTLYVFARALNGPPMPLAVVKRQAADLPLMLELDDSQSMMPQRPLSSVQEISVSARISKHGTPDPQPGDLEAVAVPVRQNGKTQSVDLLIRSIR